MAAFASQDVVGAAGGHGVHGFDADTPAHQRAQQGRRHKAQARAAAKNHQFRAEFGQAVEVALTQLFEARALPVKVLSA